MHFVLGFEFFGLKHFSGLHLKNVKMIFSFVSNSNARKYRSFGVSIVQLSDT